MEVRSVEMQLASMKQYPVLLVALLLGLSTVLAEPAVIINPPGGRYHRRIRQSHLVLIFLSVAVGLSIFMSALRILIPVSGYG